MRQILFFLLSFYIASTAYSQEYEEVEFEVKKKEYPTTSKSGVYVYRLPNYISEKGKGNAYGTIWLHGDTFIYYKGNINTQSDTSKPVIKMRYLKHVDTVSVHYITNREDTVLPLFNNNVQANVIPVIPWVLWTNDPINAQSIYMKAKNVSVVAGDTSYSCIKLLVTAPVLHAEPEKVNGEHVPSKEKWYSVNYYYLRQVDYLLVKVEEAGDVRDIKDTINQPIVQVLYELYKVFE